MNLRKVHFIGGRICDMAAQIRGRQIADHLGCHFTENVVCADIIPAQHKIFICIKSILSWVEIEKLSRRGLVIMDIIDEPPPEENVGLYLASSQAAKDHFQLTEPTVLIPHHHANISGVPNSATMSRRPLWIGSRHWYPEMEGFDYDKYDSFGMTVQEVANAHRNGGIGLNLRGPWRGKDYHVKINSGIKLLNCIGFGIPSVSADEPAYHEFGQDCTIFSDVEHCAAEVRRLQTDDALYERLRVNCVKKAEQFHIETIAGKYRALLESL